MSLRVTRASVRQPPAPDSAGKEPAPLHNEQRATGARTRSGDQSAEAVLRFLTRERPSINRRLAESIAYTLEVGEEPLRATFLARTLDTLARMAERLSPQALSEASAAGSNAGALLSILESPEAQAELAEDPVLTEARLRDVEARTAVLRAEGGTLTAEEAARQLHLTRQAIDKRRRSGELLALPIGRHRFAYPAWQFSDNGTLSGLVEVLSEFSVADPWTIALFFLADNTYLDGKRPLDELRRGNVNAVRRAAWALGQHGAA